MGRGAVGVAPGRSKTVDRPKYEMAAGYVSSPATLLRSGRVSAGRTRGGAVRGGAGPAAGGWWWRATRSEWTTARAEGEVDAAGVEAGAAPRGHEHQASFYGFTIRTARGDQRSIMPKMIGDRPSSPKGRGRAGLPPAPLHDQAAGEGG